MKDRHHNEAAGIPQLQVSAEASHTKRIDGSTEAKGTAVKELTPSTQGPSISIITPSTPENEETKRVTFEGTAEGEDEKVKSKPENEDATEQSSKGKRRPLVRSHSVEDSVRKTPGFKFITRPDLYKFAKVSNS